MIALVRVAALAAPAALAIGLLAGCATHPHDWSGTSIDIAARRAAIAEHVPPALKEAGRLPPLAVAVTVTPAPEGAPLPDEIAFPPEILGAELLDLLAASGAFESVFPVRGDVASAREEARAKGASFLLDVRIERPLLRSTGTDVPLPMLVWLFTGFPSLWIHNDGFRLEADLSVRLHDLNTGQVVPNIPVGVARAEEQLTFHERTSSVGTYFLSNVFPSPFCPIDGEKVARALATPALSGPVQALLARLGEALKGEVWRFAVQKAEDGPRIAVRYPPDGRPIFLIARKVSYAALVEAPPGTLLSEVRLNGERVFPARSAPGAVPRVRVPIEPAAEGVSPAGTFKVEAIDSRGRRSTCAIVALREGPSAVQPKEPPP